MSAPTDPASIIWWELFDETYNINYYYNTTTQETEWEKPTTGIIVVPEIEDDPLTARGENHAPFSFESNPSTSTIESYDKPIEFTPENTPREATEPQVTENQSGTLSHDEKIKQNSQNTAKTTSPSKTTNANQNNKTSFDINRDAHKLPTINLPPLPEPITGGNIALTSAFTAAAIPAPINLEKLALPRSLVEQYGGTQGPSRISCPPPRERPLLQEWEEYYDEGSDSYYYMNSISHERTWDRDVATGLIPKYDSVQEDDDENLFTLSVDDIQREYPEVQEILSVEERKSFSEPIPPDFLSTVIQDGDTEEQTESAPNLTTSKQGGGGGEGGENRLPVVMSLPALTSPPVTYGGSHVVAGSAIVDSRKGSKASRSVSTNPKKRGSKDQIQRKPGSPAANDKKAKRRGRARTLADEEPTPDRQTLSDDLKGDINMFQLTGYAEKYFETHKRGLFRRQVPVKEMLCWTKELIPTSLTRLNSELLAKDAVKCFKLIQMYMTDRPGKGEPIQIMHEIVGKGINQPELRDEIYCQLCKQTCYNDDEKSLLKGWELFVVSSMYFPPSRDLEQWLYSYIQIHLQMEGALNIFAQFVLKKLDVICKLGPRGRVPTIRELDRHRTAPFSKSVFGVSLDEVMDLQAETHPEMKVPLVVVALTESIEKTNGLVTEGIFRVPGDTEQVTSLRIQLDNGNYDLKDVTDPNTPASLLKLWMRELTEPIIPSTLYNECVAVNENEMEMEAEQALAVLDKLSEASRNTVLYIVTFLQKVAEHHDVNKMSVANIAMVFAPNFLRCPSEDPQVILNSTKHEQTWLRSLIQNAGSTL